MTEHVATIVPEKEDMKSELVCNTCKSKDFMILFNISKLVKKDTGDTYLGVKEANKFKCGTCGTIIELKK